MVDFSVTRIWMLNIKKTSRHIIQFIGLRLAVPGDRLPEATSSIVEDVPNDEMYVPEDEDVTNDVSNDDNDDFGRFDVNKPYFNENRYY